MLRGETGENLTLSLGGYGMHAIFAEPEPTI